MNRDTYIWGAGHYGVLTALSLEKQGIKICGFIDKDTSHIKTRLGLPVFESKNVLSDKNRNYQIIIAVSNESAIKEIIETLSFNGLNEGIDFEISSLLAPQLNFSMLKKNQFIAFYAGDIPQNLNYRRIGLSLTQNNENHIRHDITCLHEVEDNSVDIYQAEDVFEHIEYNKLEFVLNDIFRILKPNGLFRLSVPDYRCDIIFDRSIKDNNGNIIFDPYGGGGIDVETKQVINGGHIWFPMYEEVKKLLNKVPFSRVDFLHYYDELGNPHCNKIDYTKGFIQRTPDYDERVANPYRPMSIVVDCYK
jgi:SAM-dependent methyltransferase